MKIKPAGKALQRLLTYYHCVSTPVSAVTDRQLIVLTVTVFASDVQIVFFHFESNRIEYWTIIRNFESNRIVFAVLKSSDVKFVFFVKCEFQLLKFELNSKFVCVLDPEEREINFVHYFLHPVCVVDHPSCTTGPASQRLWLCNAWL